MIPDLQNTLALYLLLVINTLGNTHEQQTASTQLQLRQQIKAKINQRKTSATASGGCVDETQMFTKYVE